MQSGRPKFNPWIRKIPQRRAWQPYPLWYSCLENSMDRRTWWTTVHGLKQSDTTEQLSLSLFSLFSHTESGWFCQPNSSKLLPTREAYSCLRVLVFFLLWSVTWAYTTYMADLSQGSPRSLEGKRQFPCLKPLREKKKKKKKPLRDFPGGPVVNSPPANAGDMGSIPALGRFHLPMSS